MLQAWMSYGYIVLLAIGVLAYVLWRRGGGILAIASVVVGIPLWFGWEYARPTWTTGVVTGTEVRRSDPDAGGNTVCITVDIVRHWNKTAIGLDAKHAGVRSFQPLPERLVIDRHIGSFHCGLDSAGWRWHRPYSSDQRASRR